MPPPALRSALQRISAGALAPPQLPSLRAASAARSLLPFAARGPLLASRATYGSSAPPAAGGTPGDEQKLVMCVSLPSRHRAAALLRCVALWGDAYPLCAAIEARRCSSFASSSASRSRSSPVSCADLGARKSERRKLTAALLRCAGIGAAALPLAAYATGEALPPLASAGLAALFAGAARAAAARFRACGGSDAAACHLRQARAPLLARFGTTRGATWASWRCWARRVGRSACASARSTFGASAKKRWCRATTSRRRCLPRGARSCAPPLQRPYCRWTVRAACEQRAGSHSC